MNPRRRWVWVGYWAGVSLLALVLLGVSGQVLSLESAEARGRATAPQEASRLALWRMDSWLAPFLAREARRPYFEYRAVLPAGRAYEHMWNPILEGEPIVPSALIAGVPADEQATGPEGERLIRLHLQIEPDGSVTSPQRPTDAELVHLVLADPLVAANTAGRDRAGAMLSVLAPMIPSRVTLSTASVYERFDPSPDFAGRAGVRVPGSSSELHTEQFALEDVPQSYSYSSDDSGEYLARSQVARLAQQAEAPQQQVYASNADQANRLEELNRQGPGDVRTRESRESELQALASKAEPPASGELADPAGQFSREIVDGRTSTISKDTASGVDDEIETASAAGAPTPASSKRALSQAEDPNAALADAAESALGTDADLANSRVREVSPATGAEPFAEAPADRSLGVPVSGLGRAANELDSSFDAGLTTDLSFVASPPMMPTIRVGALRPRWLHAPSDPELLYLREVEIDSQTYQQGIWFDWKALRGALLAQSPGLPAGTTLDPIYPDLDTAELNPQQQLATVPAVLRLPPLVRPPLGMTPARWSLVLTWAAVIASVGAIGVVLRTAMRLSDRRVRFVGAVTHELRTPLTTFRLYSQMLADGMVTEEGARREYLNTLKQESGRLAGIVENVLAYARLNRAGRDPSRVRTEAITPEALLVRLRPGLSRRAEQSGMDLIVSNEVGTEPGGGPRELMVDPQSVERVLTNLVDNACKYAAPANEDDPDAETRIHLDLRVAGENLEILVSDYGPGIDPADRGKIFGEFQRGRAGQRADRSGLGLGLALSRGLARESGGDLRLVRRRGHGAEFLLTLPMRPRGESG